MNKLIFRKLYLDILSFFLLSSLAITLIVWVIQGVNLLDIVSEQGHAIKVYLIYSFLNIPKIFSKLITFTFFLSLFVIIVRYEENNEILVFWTNGIKKITFINFIGKLSIFFVFIQLILKLVIVPYTQNLGQEYLKNSSIEFFPNLIKEKEFSNVMRNLTIFVEEIDKDNFYKGIYIKEKLEDEDYKIIIANTGELITKNNKYSFRLLDGKITNINKTGNFNLGFKETLYNISELNSKTRKIKEVDETRTSELIFCLEKFIDDRKKLNIKCETENAFLLKDIYEELFKRAVSPIYLILLSLISSLLIIKPKNNFFLNYYKFILFFFGFLIIIFSEISYKFINFPIYYEIFFLVLPLLSIFLFYIYIMLKTNFKIKYL
tara:strand:+ start:739 stop:1869 length:1131 start_codon:yes stop_codon:yes gene_type:complete